MAQEPDAEKRGSVIALAGKRKWGYDTGQVDAFLEKAHTLYESDEPRLSQSDIQNVSFELVKNGYVIAQVDAALARLERAVVDKQTTWEINRHGRVAWRAQTESMYKHYSEHAARPQKDRFKLGKSKQPSYKRTQVDRLIDQISKKLSVEFNQKRQSEEAKDLVDLNAKRVSNVIFTQYRGKRGYDERQVDYFLNYAVQLLSRVESYVRLNDYAPSEDASSDADAQTTALGLDSQTTSVLSPGTGAGVAETQVVAPLFDMSARDVRGSDDKEANGFAVEPLAPSSGSRAEQQDDDFHRLNEAERAIFQASEPIEGNDADRTGTDQVAARHASHARDDNASGANDRSEADTDAISSTPAKQQSGVRELNQSLAFPGSANASLAALAQNQSVPSAVPEGYGAQQDNSETQLSGSIIAGNGGNAGNAVNGSDRSRDGAAADNGRQSPAVEDAATERFDPLSIQGAAQPRSWQPQQASSQTSRPSAGTANAPKGDTAVESQSANGDGVFAGTPDNRAVNAQSAEQSGQDDRVTAQPATESSESQSDSLATQGTRTQSEPKPEQQGQDPDQYLAQLTSLLDSSTFPKVDLDIPDLSFPGFDDGDGKTGSSKAQTDKR